MGCAYHPTYNFLVWRLKDETQVFTLIITTLLCVVILNALSNYPPFRLILGDDLIFFSI